MNYALIRLMIKPLAWKKYSEGMYGSNFGYRIDVECGKYLLYTYGKRIPGSFETLELAQDHTLEHHRDGVMQKYFNHLHQPVTRRFAHNVPN